MRSKHLLYFLVFLFLVVFDDIVMAANTSEFVGWGGRFTAMGGASTALSGEPSCMVTNPAGIAEHNGKKLDIALGFFLPWIEYKNQANPKETSNKDSATNPLFVIQPLLGYIQKSKDSDFAYGLGFYAIAGGGSDFTWFNEDFNSYRDIESELGILKFTPTVAYQVNSNLSLGFSPNIYYISLELKSTLGPAAIDMDAADAWGLGISFGLLYKFNDNLSAGFCYTSQSHVNDLDSDGGTLFELAPALGGNTIKYNKTKVVDLQHPQKISLGISYQLFPRILLAADVKWIAYSETFDVIKIRLTDGNGPDQDLLLPLGIDDQMVYSLGLEFKTTERLRLRCGYSYGTDVISGKALFPAMAIVESGHNLTFGFGYLWDSWSLDCALAHNYHDGNKTEVSKYASEFDNSELRFADNLITLTLTYHGKAGLP